MTSKPWATSLHRLVMAAVDVAGLAVLHVIGEQRREPRAFRHPHFVRDVEARLAAPSARARRPPGWECPAPACRPWRRSAPACRGRSRGTERRSSPPRAPAQSRTRRVRPPPPRRCACGVSPYSAGSTSPPPVSMRPSTRPRRCSGGFAADRHLDGLAAGAAHGLQVVGHPAVLGDRNQRHMSASYIRGGTATPIRSSTRVNCWR